MNAAEERIILRLSAERAKKVRAMAKIDKGISDRRLNGSNAMKATASQLAHSF